MEKYINELIAGCKYPVTFASIIDNRLSTIGIWRPKDSSNKYSSIEILDSLDDNSKLSALLHEIGHSKCEENGCRCTAPKTEEGERHAYVFTLHWLLAHKCRAALADHLVHITSISRRKDYYGVAARKVVKTCLWKRCERYIRCSWLQRLLWRHR